MTRNDPELCFPLSSRGVPSSSAPRCARNGVRLVIHHGDCLDVMAGMEPESVDAIVTDPPYGLGFMGKAWDHGAPGVPFWAEVMMKRLVPGFRSRRRIVCGVCST